ncbi:MAG: DUF58 domain-containing protein [Enterobacterales bacterium]|nr:DUF58 domain-containing protein [Enterobacterales bacterium]
MSSWSNLSHSFASSKADFDHPDFRPGIDLTLNQLLDTRIKPIIQWLDPNSRVKTSRVGGFRSRFKGRGMDFDEVRMYQMGDDIRNIDWKVTARTGKAHTKLFKEERERPVFVLIDQMPSMFFGTAQVFKSLLASHIAGQLMWQTLAEGNRFGALIFSENNHLEMKPSSSRRHCMRLLNRIVENYKQNLHHCYSDAQQNKSSGLDQAINNENLRKNQFQQSLKRLRYLAKPGSLIHIVSDFNQFDEQSQRQLSQLSQHTDLHCVLVSDPIESQLPPAGFYGISDGVNQGILNTNGHQFRDDYQTNFQKKCQQIKQFAISHRGLFTSINTNFERFSALDSSATKAHSRIGSASPLSKTSMEKF